MSRSKGLRVCAAVGLTVCVLVAGVNLWHRDEYSSPPEERKPVRLPSPNGYDTLQAAVKRVREPSRGFISQSLSARPPLPLARRKALVADNAPVYAKIREALGQEFHVPSEDPDRPFPQFAAFRELARQLTFAARTHADAGELSEAARCALDAVEIGIDVPRGGALLPGLVGIACEAIGQASLWRLADRLDAPTARAAAQRLADTQPRRWTFGETLGAEGEHQRSVNGIFFSAGPGRAAWEALREFARAPSSDGDTPPPTLKARAGALWDDAKLIYYGPRTVQRRVDDWLDAVVQRSKEPWGARRPLPPPPDDPISRETLPVFAQAEFKWFHVRTYAALLETYLALRAYRLEHGAFPQSLDALARGGYLKTVPVDPFSPTRASLRYRRGSDGTMTLWSVGPDAKDDGGKAAEVRNSDGDLRRGYVNADTVGDIVAGVNTY